jgi:methionyl-tRNA formyltransferase
MVDGLRIVFFGTPQFAVPTLEALLASSHRVIGVVTQPDRPRGRGQRVTDAPVKAAALAHGLPIVQLPTLRGDEAAAALSTWAPDLGVVAAYGQLIPRTLLELPRYGMINVHASLLPRYRGAAPVHRAIIAGDSETGVTIMRVAPKLDAGAMFAKVVVPIAPDATSDELERALADAGAQLLVAVADAIAAGTAHEEPQDERLVTYAARLTKEEGLIDWTQPARRIQDRVRGLFPWPHAYSYVNGRRVIVWRTTLDAPAGDAPADAAPGTVLTADAEGLTVAAGDRRAIALLELQPEGGRPMRAPDFLRGHPLQPGLRFTGP